MGRILDDESSFGEAGKIFDYRVSAIGYGVKSYSRAERSFLRADAAFLKAAQQHRLIPARWLKNQRWFRIVPVNESFSLVTAES